jgi:hypothetical protein
VRAGTLLFYTNLQPTLARLPYFNFADCALDFQTDFAAAYDSRERAVLHFMPMQTGTSNDYGLVNDLLRDPPKSARRMRRQVRRVLDGVTQPGVYIALGARTRDDGVQVGFDDAPICAHQSTLAERTIQAFNLPPAFVPVARAIFKCDAVVTDRAAARCLSRPERLALAGREDADGRPTSSEDTPALALQANHQCLTDARRRPRDKRRSHRRNVTDAATRSWFPRGAGRSALLIYRRSAPRPRRGGRTSWPRPGSPPPTTPRSPRSRSAASSRPGRQPTMRAGRSSPASRRRSLRGRLAARRAFINHALDLAGYTDLVSRTIPSTRACSARRPKSGRCCTTSAPATRRTRRIACVPARTFETNYYADPDAAVPANPISFEIDEAGLGVWTMWDHAQYLGDAAARSAYLADVCPSIVLGVTNLAACRDPQNGLQCLANEDDNIPLTQRLQGAETVLLALKTGVAAAAACGVDPATAAGWQARADELSSAIHDHFLDPGPPAHYVGGDRSGWLLWPVEYFAAGDPVADSQAEWLQEHSIDPILTRTAPGGAYDAENLVVRGKRFSALGDTAGLTALRDQVRFFVHELTTPGTLHMGEAYARYQADVNGDGVAPD